MFSPLIADSAGGWVYDVDLLTPWFARPEYRAVAEIPPIHIAEQVRKSVLFIGTKEKGKFRPRATAFVISLRDGEFGYRYVVTADHVISGLLGKGHDIWVRSNRKDGTAQEDNWSGTNWSFHPDVGSTDVAVATIEFSQEEDYRTIPLDGPNTMAGTQNVLANYRIEVGHEVFIAGLFRSHYGQQRNVPIIRTGNIAMMLGEKVYTKHCNYTDAYLIEARSIGGLSGSPVFVNTERLDGRDLVHRTFLLGLVHGHFDVENLTDDSVVDTDDDNGRGINTGIGVVIPVEKILETLNQPELVAMRKKSAEEFKKKNGATADVVDDEDRPSTGENPTHQEDFNRLLSNAAHHKKGD